MTLYRCKRCEATQNWNRDLRCIHCSFDIRPVVGLRHHDQKAVK